MILNMKSVDYRCYVFSMSKSDAINVLNNSWLDNKGVADVIKEGAFGETYFRDIYSGIKGKWYRNSRK